MSMLSEFGKKAGGILGTVGQFIPGPWGVGLQAAGALGSFMGASDDAKKAQRQAQGLMGYSQEQMKDLYAQMLPLLKEAGTMAGQTPYSGYTGPDPYGNQFQNSAYQAYGENTMQGADAAAASLKNAYAGRGIIGGTGIDQGLSRIYSQAGQGLGAFRRELTERGALDKRNQYQMAENARWQRLAAMPGLLTGGAGAIGNGIGGQATFAQQRADGLSAGVGGALGQVIGAGADLFKNSGIFGKGNNRTGTNQQGSNVTIPDVATGPYVPNFNLPKFQPYIPPQYRL